MSDGDSSTPLILRLAKYHLAVEGFRGLDDLRSFLSPFRDQPGESSPIVRTYRINKENGSYRLESSERTDDILRTDHPGDFLLLLNRVLIDTFLECTPSGTLLIHAAVFESDGTLVVFPGKGGAGKTTLAEELLLRSDWTFLTDELLAVDPDQGTVYPFPHPLNFKSGPRTQVTETVEVTDSAGRTFTYGLPPRSRFKATPLPYDELSIFYPDRAQGRTFDLRPLTVSAGLHRLFSHSVKPSDPADRFRRITKLKALRPDCFVMRYGDSSDVDSETLLSAQ